MPVDPTYRYADETHPRMRDRGAYGCHNHRPHRTRRHMAPNGWTEDGRRKFTPVVTKWNDVQCAHDGARTDPKCEGCRWQLWPLIGFDPGAPGGDVTVIFGFGLDENGHLGVRLFDVRSADQSGVDHSGS